MDVLRVERLHKSFGSHIAVNNLSFNVPEHAIFGFIGPNGAGKTTTMKMVLGLLRADAGDIFVCGEKVSFGQTKTNRHIGYLPDVPEFYGFMRADEYMTLCGRVTALPNDTARVRTAALLSMVGLADVKKKIRTYSRGMKQRLGIAQALLNEPKLLICDEPTSALDPVGRKEILDILLQVKGRTTVIFSTHILSDVERICDRVAMLDKGTLAMEGTLSELKAKHRAEGLSITFTSVDDKNHFFSIPSVAPFLAGGKQADTAVSLYVDDVTKAQIVVMAALAEAKIPVVKLEVIEPTIERLFMEVVK